LFKKDDNMVIHCTKKLLDEIKTTSEETTDRPLFSWHANLIFINRKKILVIENDLTRYPVILYGPKAKEFKDIGNIILTAIKETMLAENISSEVIELLIKASGPISFAKAHDRRKISFVNQTCQNVEYDQDLLDTENLNQPLLSRKLSGLLATDEKGQFQIIKEYMYMSLETLTKHSAFECKAIQLKATLKVGNHIAWRRLMVPQNISFTSLHKTLQASFNWSNTHLHEFLIYSQNKPVVRIVDNIAVFDYPEDIPRVLEKSILVSQYIPRYKKLIYRYDMGDNWEHIIEVEDFIFNYDKNYPTCIDGEGDPPPEDVGGEIGFLEFLKIIQDPKHERHDEIKDWARIQQYRPFNIDIANIKLKEIF
jgi:hypothetical protein